MKFISTLGAATLFSCAVALPTRAADDAAAPQPILTVPAGFSIELVAGPPLVERPITAAFDDEGRLYVAESSGSNDPVEKQLELQPHRIVQLEDDDGDGKFDRRIVYADKMMFPAGTMFLDGSLYVAAPPSIWKLTDRDGDGVAEERVEWFQGKTLTGCANDLHGPYLGPDGWIYWCKGAFAEQTHTVRGRPWTTRASHIFRARPDGSGLEPVLTGGMDNPVDVAFTAEGQRLLSATIIEAPGRRDGILHAIYGGVYGKDHGVLAGHPRTGELMPALVVMSPTAPSGLERYDGVAFGAEYRDNLFCAQFNVRKVTRHVLRPAGSSLASEDSDFVTSDHVDFHPTDVLADADGSLLVVDTGGWYKLCCPTSQLWKPDVLGGIYRVRRVGATRANDPYGWNIWRTRPGIPQFWELLADDRPAVRRRAARALVARRGNTGVAELLTRLAAEDDTLFIQEATPERVWSLSQMESELARRLVRRLLGHEDVSVRQTALQAVSLHRDAAASAQLSEILVRDEPTQRRLAAEALGRIGDPAAVPQLLAAAATAGEDRALQHAIAYALIEIADPAATRAGLLSEAPQTRAAALVALDQMPGGGLAASDVVPHLNSDDGQLRQAARWLAAQHPDWGGELRKWFRAQLAGLNDQPNEAGEAASADLVELLAAYAEDASVQTLLAAALHEKGFSTSSRKTVLRSIRDARLRECSLWLSEILGRVLMSGDRDLVPLAVATVRELPRDARAKILLAGPLALIAEGADVPPELRINALAASVGLALNDEQLSLLLESLAPESPVELRSAAVEALCSARLAPKQLERLAGAMKSAGPLEVNRLLAPFEKTTDERLGLALVAALKSADALPSLRVDRLRETLAGCGPDVQQTVNELEALVNVDAAGQRRRIDELLPQMAGGDVRRGHAVFHSAKAACTACHRLGHAGGTTGPELSGLGEARTERDFLESILYPSLSFVRSYEPVLIVTVDGKSINGTIVDETAEGYVLATGPNEEVRIDREDVEEMQPSSVSIMPAGLDKQLSVEELADLVAFLKNAAKN